MILLASTTLQGTGGGKKSTLKLDFTAILIIIEGSETSFKGF